VEYIVPRQQHIPKILRDKRGRFVKGTIPWNKNKITLKCHYCGRNYSVSPYYVPTSKYCSRDCMYKARRKRVTLKCKWCGKEFKIKPSKAKAGRKYCSKICHDKATLFKKGEQHPLWNEGSSFAPYPPEFTDKLKLKIKKRDGFRCSLCQLSEEESIKKFGVPLHIHHINYDKFDNSESNLITLCVCCHALTNTKRQYWMKQFSLIMQKKKQTMHCTPPSAYIKNQQR